ncbi:hypothetical protein HDU89_001612 [Geranomyces variabilis]|nr:hypothetical protein HDU89_001612 [Geranomyces variabilis]
MRLPEQLILEQCTVQEVFDATAKLLPPHTTIHEFEYFSKKLSRCIGVRLPVEPVAATAGSFNLPEFQSKKLRKCVPTASLHELEDGAANASEDQRPRFQLLLASRRPCGLHRNVVLVGGGGGTGIDLPFFLTRAQEARRTGSWKLSERTLKILKERDADVQRQTARTMAQPSVGCARAGCDIRVNSASQLKKCGRCRAVAYCSVWSQKIDWRARHKAVCTPFNGSASVTTSDATESGKEQSKNLLHGGVLFTSSTVNADFLTGFGSLWATDREKVIQNADHYPEQPPVEHGELMRQARDLMARRQFLAAKRCLNRAADDL